MISRPELLLPAGDLEIAKLAIDHGADAVYVGLSQFSARAKAHNLTQEEMVTLIGYAHERQAKVFCALNILLFNDELEEAISQISILVSHGIDAFIVQDFGIATLIMAHFPETEVHASTQMAIMNVCGVQAAEELGFDRVVLARETSLEMMKSIRNASKIDLEVFVQGALCVSYSGLCYMSSLQGDRSGNRGQCAQPCRRRYTLYEKHCEKQKKIVENYLLSPKDMNLLKNLPDLLSVPVQSLKIEGRMKQPEYVALMTDVYRDHVDRLTQGDSIQDDVMDRDLKNMAVIFNREGFSSAYLQGVPGKSMMSYHTPKNTGIPLGNIKKITKSECQILLQEPLHTGDGIAFYDAALQSLWGGYIDSIVDNNGKKGKVFGKGVLVTIKHGFSDGSHLSDVKYCYKTFDKDLSKNLLKVKTFPKRLSKKKGTLHFYVQAEYGKPFSMDVLLEKDHNEATSFHWEADFLVEKSNSGKSSKEVINNTLHKLENTGYSIGNIEINEPMASFVPMSVVTNGKNAAASFFDQCVNNNLVLQEKHEDRHFNAEERCEECLLILDEIPPQILIQNTPKISVQVRTKEQAEAALLGEIDELNILLLETQKHDGLTNEDIIQYAQEISVIVSLPPLIKESAEEDYYAARCKALFEMGIKRFMVSNIGQLKLLDDLGIEYVAGDYQMNLTNDLTAAVLSQVGVSRQTISIELDHQRLKNLSTIGNIPLEMIVYGRIPAMNTRYCPMGSIIGQREIKKPCNRPCVKNEYYLARDGKEYQVVGDHFCNIYILNDKVYSLFQHMEAISQLCLDYWRIAGAFMAPSELGEAVKVLSALRKQIFGKEKKEINVFSFQTNTTDGHFIKGVR